MLSASRCPLSFESCLVGRECQLESSFPLLPFLAVEHSCEIVGSALFIVEQITVP